MPAGLRVAFGVFGFFKWVIRGFEFVVQTLGRRNAVGTPDPFAQIDHFASLDAERSCGIVRLIYWFPTGGALHGSNDPSNEVILHAVGNLNRIELTSARLDVAAVIDQDMA